MYNHELNAKLKHAGEKSGYAYPGQSPIKIKPADVTETSAAYFNLSNSFTRSRTALEVVNTGVGLKIVICGHNSADCAATASFGRYVMLCCEPKVQIRVDMTHT